MVYLVSGPKLWMCPLVAGEITDYGVLTLFILTSASSGSMNNWQSFEPLDVLSRNNSYFQGKLTRKPGNGIGIIGSNMNRKRAPKTNDISSDVRVCSWTGAGYVILSPTRKKSTVK